MARTTTLQAATDLSCDGAKPFLRWAGSKRKVLPILRSFWHPEYRRYVEPFMGSAALFFEIAPRAAVLGDINEDLVLCFEQVRMAPRSVYWHLSRFEIDEGFYYQLREQVPSELSPAKRAARLIYLTRYCFNGLYRTNRFGQFNVPYGGRKSGQLPTLQDLYRASARLSTASLVCGDFEETIDQVRRNDFVYLDPPYWVRGRRRTNQYGPKTFYHEDLARLDQALRDIDRRGAFFVLSYEDSDEARQIAALWTTGHVSIRRNVAGFARHRHIEQEMIATNLRP